MSWASCRDGARLAEWLQGKGSVWSLRECLLTLKEIRTQLRYQGLQGLLFKWNYLSKNGGTDRKPVTDLTIMVDLPWLSVTVRV